MNAILPNTSQEKAKTEGRAPISGLSLILLLAGTLLVGFSMGRWFEWLCLFGFLFIVARALIAGRQMK